MDKTTKRVLITLGSIVAVAVGMNSLVEATQNIYLIWGPQWRKEAAQKAVRQKADEDFAFQLKIECHEDRRELRQAEEQRIAMREFRRYSEPMWEGTRFHQSKPRAVPPVESEEACKQRLKAQRWQ